MIKRLQKVGNSNAIILDKAVMELIGLREEGKVQLTVHNRSVILTPADPKADDPDKLQHCLDKVVSTRRDLLKRLA